MAEWRQAHDVVAQARDEETAQLSRREGPMRFSSDQDIACGVGDCPGRFTTNAQASGHRRQSHGVSAEQAREQGLPRGKIARVQQDRRASAHRPAVQALQDTLGAMRAERDEVDAAMAPLRARHHRLVGDIRAVEAVVERLSREDDEPDVESA